MSDRDDRELVELARRGDGSAIGELFSRYWRGARAAAFGVTGEIASAEDAAADAFRQALGALDSVREPDRFGSWLRTIVVRRARLDLVRRRRVSAALTDDVSDRAEGPDEMLERLEAGALIQRAIRELPPRLREAVALTYFEGYDSDAAARFLDIPAGTLRRRLHDGRARLRVIVGTMLKGNHRGADEHERRLDALKAMIADGETYRAMREALALRPPPRDLVELIVRKSSSGDTSASGSHAQDTARLIRQTAQHFARPSPDASDPHHAIGSAAVAIRAALPEFQEWTFDAGEAAARLLATGEDRGRLRTVMPPGFAEGRPGAFLRSVRGLVRVRESGDVQSVYELLQASPDEATFRGAAPAIRISDVLDLTWMTTGPLELRSVQERLERLATAVLGPQPLRFSAYDEPRYRHALQLHVADRPVRLAQGGVLAAWPGRPEGMDAAHVRIFLEPWASIRSGREIEWNRLPRFGDPSDRRG